MTTTRIKQKLIKERNRHLPWHITNSYYLISAELSLLFGKRSLLADFITQSPEWPCSLLLPLTPTCFPYCTSAPHSSLQVICLPLHQRGGHTKHKFPHLLSSNSYLTSLLWDSLCPHIIPPHQHLHPSLFMCFLPSPLPLIESHFLPTSPTLSFFFNYIFTFGKKHQRLNYNLRNFCLKHPPSFVVCLFLIVIGLVF